MVKGILMKPEVAEKINESMQEERFMGRWAKKVKANAQLNEEETAVAQVIDTWAKEIGRGERPVQELSAYIRKVVEPEVYNAPDELLDVLFNRGTIGEFDEFGVYEDAVNTLVAYEAVKNGGNVDKSYLDYRMLKPTWKHLQIETEVRMDKLRKGGYKTIAEMQVYAEEAFKNAMFYHVFAVLDGAITKPIVSVNPVTQSAMDELTGYILDRGENTMVVGLSSLIRPLYRHSAVTDIMSNEMKNELNTYGMIKQYNGVDLMPLSPARKLANGQTLLPQDKVFGIADKVGDIEMRGEMRVLSKEDINREVIELKYTGFEFGMVIKNIDKVTKLVIS